MEMKPSGTLSGLSSDYDKNRCGGQSDSGRGSTVYSSGKLKHTTDTSPDSSEPHRLPGKQSLNRIRSCSVCWSVALIGTPLTFFFQISANKDNQWVDMVENELKHILEPKSNASMGNSTLSDSSASPPLPPVSPGVSSDEMAAAYKHKG